MTTIPVRTNLAPPCLRVLHLTFRRWLVLLGAFREKRVAGIRSMATVIFAIVTWVGFNARPGNAQEAEGTLTLHGDFYACSINDDGPGLKTVYVSHRINAATAARFMIEAGPGMTMTYVSEIHSYPMTVGNSQDGMSVCYGSCVQGSILLATLTYMSYGTSNGCSRLQVVPHPSAATLDAVLCGGIAVATDAMDMYVATGPGCGCPIVRSYPGTPELFDCDPVAVQASTWGAIKALYRD